jgi:plasmid stability protein
MAQVIIRNINERAIQRIKTRAKRHGHSLEQELRNIITTAAHLNMEEARNNIATFRSTLESRQHSDSTLLIREDRDR